jgi:hypothetical protein
VTEARGRSLAEAVERPIEWRLDFGALYAEG